MKVESRSELFADVFAEDFLMPAVGLNLRFTSEQEALPVRQAGIVRAAYLEFKNCITLALSTSFLLVSAVFAEVPASIARA